jgi:diguanylate cyclase (GGDEF)-like protein
MIPEGRDIAELLKREQERSAQLAAYASDLNRTYHQLRRHLGHMTVLHEVTTRIASALDPDEVLASMLDSLSQLVAYQTAVVYLVDLNIAAPEEGPRAPLAAVVQPTVRAARSVDEGRLEALIGSVAPPDGTIVEAIRDQQTAGHIVSSGALQLVVPLWAGGRSLGAIEVNLSQPLPDEDVKLIELLTAAVAVALQNAHLYQETQRLATTDALTGVSNYRHFHDLLSLEVQRARRLGYPVGLLIMDLDYFKQVNDRHGHPMGDFALREVAERLRQRLRRTDVVGRLGGDEFGAILPGDTLAEVVVVAEKLRHSVEELAPLRGGMTTLPTRITLSVGGASLGAAEVNAELLVSRADQALYQAKGRGGNQVRIWTDEPVTPEPTGTATSESRTG